MLDKIVIVGNQAHFIYESRKPFTLTSDTDVKLFLQWFLGAPNVKLFQSSQSLFEHRINSDKEITIKIDIKGAA
jgi:hypothetical protein